MKGGWGYHLRLEDGAEIYEDGFWTRRGAVKAGMRMLAALKDDRHNGRNHTKQKGRTNK